jgi:fucose permease
MITAILLIIIYLAFISLGLPDSILGVTLPAIQLEWGLPLSSGSIVSMTVIGSTILSSFLSGYIIKKIGTGKIVFLSCLLTGSSLLGISFAPSFYWLLVLAVPLGFGGGAVDTALNNFVALNYKARHMNWLHSFWGVGATLGPIIMSLSLLSSNSWRMGYRNISIIQLSLSVLLLMSIPLWRKFQSSAVLETGDSEKDPKETNPPRNVFKIKGVKYAFVTLMLYCAVESAVGLWGSSYLIQVKKLSMERAASWIAFYYGGITLGRFISGFISYKLSNVQMIKWGIVTAFSGILIFLLPVHSAIAGAALVLIGLGLSPVFPSMLHETPVRFGKENSQVLIGFQMGFAYIGSAVLSPFLGVVLQFSFMGLFPFLLLGFTIIMFISSEKLTQLVQKPYEVVYEN